MMMHQTQGTALQSLDALGDPYLVSADRQGYGDGCLEKLHGDLLLGLGDTGHSSGLASEGPT